MESMNDQAYIQLCEAKDVEVYENNYKMSPKYADIDVSSVFTKLKGKGISVSLQSGTLEKEFNNNTTEELIYDMAGFQMVEFKDDVKLPKAGLKSCSESFRISNEKKAFEYWQVSRFSYIHFEGEFVIRNPKAHCFIVVYDEAVMKLFYDFRLPISINEIQKKYENIPSVVIDFFIQAEIISPCSDEKVSDESKNEVLRQWDFHDLLFHSLSRTGRTEKDIGGSFRFKGILPPQPPLKENIWKDNSIALPVPNLYWLNFYDKPFTHVLESRTSIRDYGILPLTIGQLGEFLFRSARVRYEFSGDFGDFISKPYPGGGANYETEFYITINSCAGVPRGMYYYDPKDHMLSLVSEPNDEMEKLIYDASMATAFQGTPQILITLANRFNRFNWKYSSMSYAAQLKNIGVIYQTLYLVATSMGIGACGLGVGNTERFSRLTGLNYFEEGSVGEFMIGRPL